MNNAWDDMQKVIKVFESCKTLEQVNTAVQMFMKYRIFYENDTKNQDRLIIRAWIQALRKVRQNDEL